MLLLISQLVDVMMLFESSPKARKCSEHNFYSENRCMNCFIRLKEIKIIIEHRHIKFIIKYLKYFIGIPRPSVIADFGFFFSREKFLLVFVSCLGFRQRAHVTTLLILQKQRATTMGLEVMVRM